MQKLVIVILVLVSPLLLSAQSGKITEGEREFLTTYFSSVKERLKSTLDEIDDSEWKTRRSDGGWSPAETMEHIIIGCNAQLGGVMRTLKGNEVKGDLSANDGLLLSLMTDRGKQFQTPLPPKTNGAQSKEQLFSAFEELEDKWLVVVNDRNLKLRNYHGMSPFQLKADGYQQLLLVAGHAFRHTGQIIETLNEMRTP